VGSKERRKRPKPGSLIGLDVFAPGVARIVVVYPPTSLPFWRFQPAPQQRKTIRILGLCCPVLTASNNSLDHVSRHTAPRVNVNGVWLMPNFGKHEDV
jgi:hypothetical protein